MHKKIYGISLCLIVMGMGFYLNKSNHVVKKIAVSSPVAITQGEQKIPETLKAVYDGQVEKSFEEIESELDKKSDEEIKKTIVENNSWAETKKFVALANSNQLDEKDRGEFLKYMRLNTVLHKILIDRSMEEMDRANL